MKEVFDLFVEATGTLWSKDMEWVRTVDSKEDAEKWQKEDPWLREYEVRQVVD